MVVVRTIRGVRVHGGGQKPREVPRAAICYNFAPNAVFDYLAGVEVSSFKDVPAEFTQLSIPPQRYAVFPHADHVSKLSELWMAIFQEWLPKSGREFSGGPSYERYDASFDPKSGMGGMEIWLAVKN